MPDLREGSALLECTSTSPMIRYLYLQGPGVRKHSNIQSIQGEMGLIINAANCIHCKTCDIKVIFIERFPLNFSEHLFQ